MFKYCCQVEKESGMDNTIFPGRVRATFVLLPLTQFPITFAAETHNSNSPIHYRSRVMNLKLFGEDEPACIAVILSEVCVVFLALRITFFSVSFLLTFLTFSIKRMCGYNVNVAAIFTQLVI